MRAIFAASLALALATGADMHGVATQVDIDGVARPVFDPTWDRSADRWTPKPSQTGVMARVKDIAGWANGRDNQIVGYGLVVGLSGSGDSSRATPFTSQSLDAMLTRLGIATGGLQAGSRNIAAVLVTASLPPFVQPGARVDVSVSSLGDATSLRGGTLVMTALRGGNDEIYAVAQGSVLVGGFSAQGAAEGIQEGVPTSGRVVAGGIIEQEPPAQLAEAAFTLLLRNPDFATAIAVADAANAAAQAAYGRNVAFARDAATLILSKPDGVSPARFIAHMESLTVATDQAARVVVNARTGTIVIGAAVRVAQVAVTHGALTVRVTEAPVASQPNPFSDGATVVLPDTTIDVAEPGGTFTGVGGTDLESLVDGLNQLGVTPSDTIAILQAIAGAGALQAELVVQ
ncbi:MAG: flagellar basal body P-ring protein FlgI [Pseudomonadota bacterium]